MAKVLAASFSGAIGISIDEVLVKKETRDIDSRIAKIETARENLLEAISAIDEIKATAEENKRELAELQKSVTKIGKQKEELTQDREWHRKVNRHRSKMLRAAFAYAVCRRAISFHICMASVLSSR
jgi:chromosome segregation ATPase